MRTPNDLWEALGALAEDEAHHTLTRLFVFYEELMQKSSDSKEAQLFFRNLDTVLTQTEQCNLNRR